MRITSVAVRKHFLFLGNGHENCWICTKSPRKPDGASEDKPFRCAICNRTFPVAAHLKRHQKIHTGEKPHQCQQCGKAFALAQNLKLHMRVHTGEKPYSCTFCEKRFPGHSDLAKHLRTHTGERPYSCEHCDQSFVSASGLRRHHLVHTGEKPHSCPHCKRTFRRKWHLVLHVRAHTGERPHPCHLCDKAYRDKSSLNKHLRDHQSGKLEEKERVKEQRAAILAAKTLARSSASLLKRKRKSNAKTGKKTSQMPSTSEPEAVVADEQTGDVSSEKRLRTDSGVEKSKKSREKKQKENSVNKAASEKVRKKNFHKKKNLENTKTTSPPVASTSGCGEISGAVAQEGAEKDVSGDSSSKDSGRNDPTVSNQGEKLQALADAATIHATTLHNTESSGEQTTAFIEDFAEPAGSQALSRNTAGSANTEHEKSSPSDI